MKIRMDVNSKVTVEVDGALKDCVEQLSQAWEVFEDSECRVCGGPVRVCVRTVDDNKYYSLSCTNPECRAELSFGQTKKDNRLYPKRWRTDKNGQPLVENGRRVVKGKWGWAKWEKPDEGF